jgi:hypothetical protein
MSDLKNFHSKLEAKINIQNNIDNFAIEFATFIADENYDLDFWVHNSDIKILLEIFKEQRR